MVGAPKCLLLKIAMYLYRYSLHIPLKWVTFPHGFRSTSNLPSFSSDMRIRQSYASRLSNTAMSWALDYPYCPYISCLNYDWSTDCHHPILNCRCDNRLFAPYTNQTMNSSDRRSHTASAKREWLTYGVVSVLSIQCCMLTPNAASVANQHSATPSDMKISPIPTKRD